MRTVAIYFHSCLVAPSQPLSRRPVGKSILVVTCLLLKTEQVGLHYLM